MVDLMCDSEKKSFYKRCGFLEASGMMKRNYENQNGVKINKKKT